MYFDELLSERGGVLFSNMRYVYEVYKTGSFSKAAKNLYVSQPALSATVKKVENKIGMPLFDRSVTPIRLTECGRRYIKTAESIIRMEEEFSDFIDDLKELKTGHLNIGGTYLFMVFVLPEAIRSFHSRYPAVELNVYEGHTSQLETMLFSGDIDLFIDNYPMDKDIYERKFFMKEHLLLAVPKSFSCNKLAREWALTAEDIVANKHLLAETKGVPLSLFSEEPFIFLRAYNDTRERVETICKHAKIQPNVILMLDQMLMTYGMTAKGMGISFVSDTVVRSQNTGGDLVYYKVDDPEAERNVYFYYKRNRYLSKSMEEFMKIAFEVKE